jgi:hypothetical protein
MLFAGRMRKEGVSKLHITIATTIPEYSQSSSLIRKKVWITTEEAPEL